MAVLTSSRWRKVTPMTTKREIIETALKALMDAEGRLTPGAVVAAAKAKSHPLHEFFEWDVRKAARLHWLETASTLIRMVQFRETVEERTVVAPYFVRDPERPPNEQGYRAIQHIRTDEESARDVLVDEMQLVVGVLRRARSVAVVLGMVDAISEIEDRVSAFIGEIEKRGDEVAPPA